MKSPEGRAKSVLSLSKKSAAMKDDSYQIILTFNGNAELIDIAYPQNFSVELVNNHLSVASLFFAQKMVANKGG
jgi:hypothetical protein